MQTCAFLRGLIGKELKRRFELNGEKLLITPVNSDEGWRVSDARLDPIEPM